jgi:hypothetical protein
MNPIMPPRLENRGMSLTVRTNEYNAAGCGILRFGNSAADDGFAGNFLTGKDGVERATERIFTKHADGKGVSRSGEAGGPFDESRKIE